MEYTLRKYQNEDFQFIYDVKKICYQKYVEEFFGGWDDDVQMDMFKKYIESAFKNIKIILVDGKQAGFIEGCEVDENNYDLGNICLLPEYQGKGIGSKSLNDMVEKNKDKNLHLKVFKSNPAQNLYKKLGFETTEETMAHYIMKKTKQVEKDK